MPALTRADVNSQNLCKMECYKVPLYNEHNWLSRFLSHYFPSVSNIQPIYSDTHHMPKNSSHNPSPSTQYKNHIPLPYMDLPLNKCSCLHVIQDISIQVSHLYCKASLATPGTERFLLSNRLISQHSPCLDCVLCTQTRCPTLELGFTYVQCLIWI